MIKFVLQTIKKEIEHDFVFTLREAINYTNWLYPNSMRYIYAEDILPKHRSYIPVGSVEFVSKYLKMFFDKVPKPVNVPESLRKYNFTGRLVLTGTEKTQRIMHAFVKSNDIIKGYSQAVDPRTILSPGNYQISEILSDIQSEWRCFVYKKNLLGIHYYSGDFTRYPNIGAIKKMINNYREAPCAYTLDVGMLPADPSPGSLRPRTIIIEAHDFFSCGLYGFNRLDLLPKMFADWYAEYTKKSEEGV